VTLALQGFSHAAAGSKMAKREYQQRVMQAPPACWHPMGGLGYAGGRQMENLSWKGGKTLATAYLLLRVGMVLGTLIMDFHLSDANVSPLPCSCPCPCYLLRQSHSQKWQMTLLCPDSHSHSRTNLPVSLYPLDECLEDCGAQIAIYILQMYSSLW